MHRVLLSSMLVCFIQASTVSLSFALPRPPLWPPLPELVTVLHRETFDDVYYAGVSNTVVAIPNYGTLRESWSGYSLERVETVTPLVIPGLGETGQVQVVTDQGAIRFWFSPYWSSGKGPGTAITLAELAAVNGSQIAALWSLQVSADGSGLQLLGPEGKQVLLEAKLAWAAGSWHQVVLNYGINGTELVLDGEVVAQGEATLTVPTKAARLVVGSSLSGELAADGELEEVFCFARPLKLAFHYLPFRDIAALGPMSEAELAYRQELMAKWAALKAEKAKEAEESGDGGVQMLRLSGPAANCVTNGPVYLTNVVTSFTTNDGWTVYFDIAGGTNGVVYDIFSTTEFVGNDITNSVWTWLETGLTCETHYFTNQPTNQVFYILTVPGADRDGDGLYDGWEWKHFGTLEQSPDGDFDNDGRSNGLEYTNAADPNTIAFDVAFTNLYVRENPAAGTFDVLQGVPAQMAVLVDSTNFASATWQSFNSNLLVNLGVTDKTYDVWIGLKGRAANSQATWSMWSLTRDTVPPLIVITNPMVSMLSQPMIQLQGYSPEPLANLYYDAPNAAGSLTNEQGYVTKQWFDTNLFALTTNWFECVDIVLTNGENVITLRASDQAGNVTTNVYTYVLDYSGDTNPPALVVYWPQGGAQISGDSFTFRGWLDDPTASVAAEIVDANDVTNAATGLLERDGLLWVDDLPLGAGTNTLTLTMTDAAGNLSVTNLSVIKSAVILTLDDLSNVDMNQPRINVSGTINVSDHKIWVNGVEVTNLTGGSWYVEGVPVNEGGTAVIQARAIPNTDNNGNGTSGSGGSGSTMQNPGNPTSTSGKTAEAPPPSKNPEVVVIHYHKTWDYKFIKESKLGGSKLTDDDTIDILWNRKEPGHWIWDSCYGNASRDDFYYEWSKGLWDENNVGTQTGNADRGTKGGVCGVQVTGWVDSYTPPGWGGQFCDGEEPRSSEDQSSKFTEQVKRNALTRYELHTGGKKMSGRKSLFVLSGSATGIGNLFYPEADNNPRSYTIANNAIVLGDLGKLGSDGLLYKALGDGETYDVTPKVAGRRYYTYSQPGQSKHTPHIDASGHNLDNETPEFCVGEPVVFNFAFYEPISYVDLVGQWRIPDKFVNESFQYSSTCASYKKNDDLLKNTSSTACWFVNGNGGTVSLGASLKFANGQMVSLAVIGKVIVYRPRIWLQPFNPGEDDRYYTLSYENPLSCKLKLGEDDESGEGTMRFTVNINSKYPGDIGLTQLIIANYVNPAYNFSSERCDGSEFYSGPNGVVGRSNPDIPTGLVGLSDGPSSIWTSPNWVDLSCRDFVRFRPNGGIWVTLGIATWETVGAAQTILGDWYITDDQTTGPDGPDDSDEFPIWTINQGGMH